MQRKELHVRGKYRLILGKIHPNDVLEKFGRTNFGVLLFCSLLRLVE